LFHVFILSAIVLSGCGYKGNPVYKTDDGKKIEYNSTGHIQAGSSEISKDTN
jgi:hypothetical protein